MDISKGYLRLYRQILDWEWYDNPFVKAIFFHCLISANNKTKEWRDLKLKRGQFVTSYEKLAASNGMTIQQTRTALKQLQLTHEIEYQSTNQYTVITVKNYNLYQADNIQKFEADTTPNNKRKGKQVTTTNNIDNTKEYIYNSSSSSKEEIKLTEEEEEFLKKFSKRVDRKIKNYRLWRQKVIESGGYLDILKEEKERLAKLKLAKQQAEVNIPPAEKIEKSTPEEDKAGLKLLRETAQNIRKRG